MHMTRNLHRVSATTSSDKKRMRMSRLPSEILSMRPPVRKSAVAPNLPGADDLSRTQSVIAVFLQSRRVQCKSNITILLRAMKLHSESTNPRGPAEEVLAALALAELLQRRAGRGRPVALPLDAGVMRQLQHGRRLPPDGCRDGPCRGTPAGSHPF